MTCASSTCAIEFAPGTWNQRFCSLSCKRREGNRQYRKNNPHFNRMVCSERYWTHRDQHLKVCREYRRRVGRGILNARHKNWRDHNQDTLRWYDANRRSSIRSTPKSLRITSEEWDDIKKRFDYRCAYCLTRPDKLTQDHVVPLCRGGSHTKDNIVPACKGCNCKKGSVIITPKNKD